MVLQNLRQKYILVIEESCKLELNSFLRNGDFLFVRCNYKMILYSPGKKIFTELDKNGVTVHNRQIGGIGSGTSSIFGFVHKPSFVSLKDMFGIDDNSIEGLNLRLRHSTQISHCLHFFVVVTISMANEGICRSQFIMGRRQCLSSKVFYKDDPLFFEARKFLDYGTVLFSWQKFVFV
ncbi:hypothetical protein NC651_018882 [Populus alba x Populus x berolinensis]|nr:hypothetical protein NC651_018882 [Populus alba x Populus x berolinensis]